MIFTLRIGGGDAVAEEEDDEAGDDDDDDDDADDDADDDDEDDDDVETCRARVGGIAAFGGGSFDQRGRANAKGCILCRNCVTSMFHLQALHGCSGKQSALHFIAGAFVGIAPGSPFRLSPAS